MSDYIDRDGAIRAFCENCIEFKTCQRDDDLCDDLFPIVRYPAADVAEVVRCKDCIHAIFVLDGVDACVCSMGDLPVCRDKDFFCADGERRADNG